MTSILLITGVLIVLAVLPLCIAPRKSIAFLPYRGFLIVLSGAAFLFSVFGFLATFEPSGASMLPWRIGYGCIGLVSSVGCVYLLIITVKGLVQRQQKTELPSTESAQNRPG